MSESGLIDTIVDNAAFRIDIILSHARPNLLNLDASRLKAL